MASFRGVVRRALFVMTVIHATVACNSTPEPSALLAEPDCSRSPGSLPFVDRPAGAANAEIPIEHVVVIMQENRSFDHYFGRMNAPEFYGSELDGVSDQMSNPDSAGNPVYVHRSETYCTIDTAHSWDASHKDWNGGLNDGFVVTNESSKHDGKHAMAHFTKEDIPFYYSLANQFAIADRYFSSVMGPTMPNRFYLMAGTSFGWTKNPKFYETFNQKTIFDVMTENGIGWKYYFTDLPYLLIFREMSEKNRDKFAFITQYYADLRNGNLPQVAFVETSQLLASERAPVNIQLGQASVAKKIQALMNSRHWKDSVLFLTYDEGGGIYDHVSPPKACVPDDKSPQFDHYGFRVPLIAVSPYVKRHHVSHVTYDHTSILKFIETKFNLPALSRRDANADAMMDLFDFRNPRFDVPELDEAKIDWGKLLDCVFRAETHSSLQ